MKKQLCFLLLLSCFCKAESLVVATDVWPPYTTEQSNGLYEALFKKVYPNLEVQFVYSDYARTKALLVQGKADLWLGAYKDEEDYAITPHEAMDADFVYAIYLTSRYPNQPPEYQNAPAVWLTDYLYDQYFPQYNLQGYEVNDIVTAFRLLRAEKIRFILSDDSEMLDLMATEGISNEGLTWIRFGVLPLYPAFAETPRSAALIQQWDHTLAQLKSNGELAKLFEEFGLLSEYPF
ncbi:substrate-binding periplasmic protein [Planctobacterium marinum]|uniref:Solute-binding protein family 3/N-terminal domain-containing protein n=1 Tax=Planctobacterium marinum TaxID=1631968 RepID=A0AA48HS46_9ALTE|nr:hypothetical protein MACH26_41380 [Planctobacterium marinum]